MYLVGEMLFSQDELMTGTEEGGGSKFMYGWRAYWDCLQKNLSFRQSSSVIQMSIKWRWRWWRITSPRIDQHFIHLIEMSVFCLISNKVILRVCFIIDGVVYHNIIYTYMWWCESTYMLMRKLRWNLLGVVICFY